MSDSPYSAGRAPKALRSFRRNPYSFRSKWNAIRIVNAGIAGGLALSALNDPDKAAQALKFGLLAFQGKYYLKNLYNVDDMEKTIVRWNFRWKGLKIPYLKKNQNIKVKFRLENETLQKYCPVEEFIVVEPRKMTIIRNVGNVYSVLWDGTPKKPDDETRPVFELSGKKFLDGLPEGRHFKSIWYTVSNPKKECVKALTEAANEGEQNKARDLHMQDMIQCKMDDNRPKSVTKYVYLQDLGYCKDIQEAIIRYNSTVPGLEELLKSTASGFHVITDPMDIWKVFEEYYGDKEAVL
jgi:hypothetical protein